MSTDSTSTHQNTQITLIGKKLAEVGNEFIFEGGAEGCDDCPHSSTCLSLEEGVRYRIVDVREGGQDLDCGVHAGGSVRAVEVTESPVLAQVDSKKAFEGSTVSIDEETCDKKECKGYKYCVPDGLDFGEDYTIKETAGGSDIDCEHGRSLEFVELEKD
ncbi:UPF0179 family protein [Halorutilales archaeon Cl-col2-1]